MDAAAGQRRPSLWSGQELGFATSFFPKKTGAAAGCLCWGEGAGDTMVCVCVCVIKACDVCVCDVWCGGECEREHEGFVGCVHILAVSQTPW